METVIAASPLLGHELEDRRPIGAAQEEHIAERFALASTIPLAGPQQRDLFCVAPLDLLVSEQAGRKQFHLLELNGTGIGGLTNLTDRAVSEVLQSLAESCTAFDDPDGVVLLAVSGKESESSPRLNRLMHEKLLFVEAMRQGLSRRFGGCEATNLALLREGKGRRGMPAVALGYIKDFLNDLTVEYDGSAWLHGRRVIGAVNDRFCRNMLQRFDERVDLEELRTLNRCFSAGSDKGVAYSLMNEFVQARPQPGLPSEILNAHADSRLSLVQTVLDWMARGRQVVIKPHGTGLGHGIEFFLDPQESYEQVVARIDRSLCLTEEYYGISGGALPYTVCEYVDACRVAAKDHPLEGHKYELRVVVYRHGMTLRAFPSIAKVARERDDLGGRVRRALINNITASGDTSKVSGVDYMLPLCNQRSLGLLGLSIEDVESLCAAATGYVRYVLDQVDTRPERFGLPAHRQEVGTVAVPAAA
ncbi:MAG: hypothetical protein DWQ37_08195 [Planctomycetota bacterium]|nr:MAG: hypothetical protein DWQ37_08195 [Planctomycetota bacterium]